MTEQTARALTGYGARCRYQHFSTLGKLPLSLQKVFQIEEVSHMATIKSESCSPLQEIKSVSSVWQGDGKSFFSDSGIRNVIKIKLKWLHMSKLEPSLAHLPCKQQEKAANLAEKILNITVKHQNCNNSIIPLCLHCSHPTKHSCLQRGFIWEASSRPQPYRSLASHMQQEL